MRGCSGLLCFIPCVLITVVARHTGSTKRCTGCTLVLLGSLILRGIGVLTSRPVPRISTWIHKWIIALWDSGRRSSWRRCVDIEVLGLRRLLSVGSLSVNQ